MRLLICGSRHWNDYETIWHEVATLPSKPKVVITGGDVNGSRYSQRGADLIATKVAKDMKISYQIYYADWKRYGRRAGPLRNKRMLEEGKPTFVLAFPAADSKGTIDMIRQAEKAGIPVRIVDARQDHLGN
jgi:hypothetical protein